MQSKPRDEREALGDQAESRVGIARQSEIKLSPGEQEQEMHQVRAMILIYIVSSSPSMLQSAL